MPFRAMVLGADIGGEHADRQFIEAPSEGATLRTHGTSQEGL
jgi:hypothetical protein